jgi:hypothetical protein
VASCNCPGDVSPRWLHGAAEYRSHKRHRDSAPDNGKQRRTSSTNALDELRRAGTPHTVVEFGWAGSTNSLVELRWACSSNTVELTRAPLL